jgi:O-acetyl-ADP-ribose deacetylase (regulator of RNase III)
VDINDSGYQFDSGQRLEIVRGDLTEQIVDAIVNAANEHLIHGGGVAGIIVGKGGRIIQQESDEWIKKNGRVTHESPAFTSAGSLPASYIIHAVGPVWGSGDEDAKLAAAISGSLKLADELNLGSIAFPAISTGIFGFPKDRAAQIFMQTVSSYFSANPYSVVKLVRITLYDEPTYNSFMQAFNDAFTAS